jgi:hypothetical protein
MVGVGYEMWRSKYGANQKAVPGAKDLMIKAQPAIGMLRDSRYNNP